MFTPLQKKKDSLLAYQSYLDHNSVPGSKKTHTIANGFVTLIHLNEDEFYINVYVTNIKNIIMSHIHLINQHDKEKNGPILLWLTDSMSDPISIQNGYLVTKKFSIQDLKKSYLIHDAKDFIRLIHERKIYVNVHTKLYPNGEIAGVLYKIPM
jgi:hypothetical protein